MGALQGIRVVEMAGLAPAPFCGMILADFGADVVRVDRVGAGSFDHLARGKRSMAVNLKSPDGVETVLRLVERADVLLEPYRPGVMERLGLGPGRRLRAQPAARVRAPDRLRPGRPVRRHGRATTSTTSPSPARCRCSAARARSRCRRSTCSATSPAAACCARSASRWRCSSAAHSGKGQIVDAAMVDGAAYLSTFVYKFRNAGMWRDERGTNLLDGGAPFYDTYRTKDGQLHVGRRHRAAVLRGAAQGPRPRRGDHAAADGSVEAGRRPRRASPRSSPAKTRAEWCAIFDGTDACVAPVLGLGEVGRSSAQSSPRAADPRRARANSSRRRHRACRARRATAAGPLPQVGEHTRAILGEYGFSSADIDGLLNGGAIG